MSVLRRSVESTAMSGQSPHPRKADFNIKNESKHQPPHPLKFTRLGAFLYWREVPVVQQSHQYPIRYLISNWFTCVVSFAIVLVYLVASAALVPTYPYVVIMEFSLRENPR